MLVINEIKDYIKSKNIVFLHGDLGAGKTFLFRELLLSLGYKDEVTSPTFSIKKEYEIDEVTYSHYDLYREVDQNVVISLINEDLMNGNIIFIEWPEKIKKLKKLERLDVYITEDHEERKYELKRN